MSIKVNDFRWEPGTNDAEYIKLLESSRDEWERIAQKAISKLKTLSKAQEPIETRLHLCESCTKKYPECDATADGVEFGNGTGNDNIIGCTAYTNRWKAQKPRVMTWGDLRDIGSVWELNTPPYLWMDINPSYRWSRGFWVAWREIYDMIDGLHPTYNADNYGKIWRCWTSKPSLKQMEETSWE